MRAWVDSHLDRWFATRPAIPKLIRYSSASVAGTVATQAALVITFGIMGLEAGLANVLSVTAGAVPNYLINRAWTFDKHDSHSFHREVLPFWGLTIAGLILSTIAVSWAADRFDDSYLAVSLANMSAFGVLWVGKYFILERVLFRSTTTPSQELADESV